jgi:hypothetical protein
MPEALRPSIKENTLISMLQDSHFRMALWALIHVSNKTQNTKRSIIDDEQVVKQEKPDFPWDKVAMYVGMVGNKAGEMVNWTGK